MLNPCLFIYKKKLNYYLLTPQSFNILKVNSILLNKILNKEKNLDPNIQKTLKENKIIINNFKYSKYETDLVLKITSKCNFNCEFCSQKNIPVKKEYMSFSTAKAAIDKFVKLKQSCYSLCFFGGEPLLNASLIKKCILYTKLRYPYKKWRYGLNTNGWLLKNNISWLDKKNILIAISVEGDKDCYNLTNELDKYDNIFNAIKKFKHKDNLIINTVVTYNNINKISNIIEEFQKIGINKQGLCIPSFDINKYWKGNGILIAKKIFQLFEKCHKKGIKIIFSNWGFWMDKEYNCRALDGKSIFLNTSGDSELCHSLPIKLGSIHTTNAISELLVNKSNFPIQINKELSFCKPCKIQKFCKGGCLADLKYQRSKNRVFCNFAKTFFKLYLNYLINKK